MRIVRCDICCDVQQNLLMILRGLKLRVWLVTGQSSILQVSKDETGCQGLAGGGRVQSLHRKLDDYLRIGLKGMSGG